MKKLYIAVLSSIILSGCSAKAVLVEKSVNYDPSTEARIRMYYVNGNPTIKVHSNMDCPTWEGTIAQKPQRRSSSGLPKKTLKNVSIGIPMTERSAAALRRDDVNDTDSFMETVVKAKEKTIADAAVYYARQYNCRIAGEFIPEAGKDYEITFPHDKTRCHLNIVELKPSRSPNLAEKITVEAGKKLSYKACNYNYDDLNLLKKLFK